MGKGCRYFPMCIVLLTVMLVSCGGDHNADPGIKQSVGESEGIAAESDSLGEQAFASKCFEDRCITIVSSEYNAETGILKLCVRSNILHLFESPVGFSNSMEAQQKFGESARDMNLYLTGGIIFSSNGATFKRTSFERIHISRYWVATDIYEFNFEYECLTDPAPLDAENTFGKLSLPLIVFNPDTDNWNSPRISNWKDNIDLWVRYNLEFEPEILP